MDLLMPGIDGHTATRQVREWEKSAGKTRTPIVALTAHALRDEMQKSLEAGCDAHITKPIRRADLIRAISKYARPSRVRPKAQILSQLSDIVPDFMERRKHDVEALRLALETADYKTVHVVAHNLKGSGGGYGFDPISEIGADLEDAVDVRDHARMARSIDALAEYLREVDVEYVTPEEVPV
jgi:response regulator RpfG family c-di-GMP phosphodiesterase